MAVYNDSQFNMWRGCIAAAWIDGKADSEELEWITDKINHLKFTDSQKKDLLSDLNNAIDFTALVSLVTDKIDRAFLHTQVSKLSNLDKDYSEAEKALFLKWKKIVKQAGEFPQITDGEVKMYEKDDVFLIVNKHSMFKAIADSILGMIDTKS